MARSREPRRGVSTVTWKLGLMALGALFVLAGCAPGGGASAVDLDGSWSLTWEGTTTRPAFGTTGAMTLDVTGDTAHLVGVDAANGAKLCRTYAVAYLPGDLVLLDDPSPFSEEPTTWGFVIERVDGDTVRLSNALEAYVLERIDGAPPVDGCGDVTADAPVELPLELASSRTLNPIGSTLYLNTSGTGAPIVGWSVESMAIVSTRTLTDAVGFGSPEPYVAAARTDDLFYGTCRCGRNTRFTYFDVESDTAISQHFTADVGFELGIRYGGIDPISGHLVLGGVGYEDGAQVATNRLLTLDADTLALATQRDVLTGAQVRDLAWIGERLVALTTIGGEGGFDALVEVGSDGRGTETYDLGGVVTGYPVGIAGVGDVLYVLVQDFEEDAVHLYGLTLD